MANKRTVDPTAGEASSQIIGVRVTATQLKQIAELCERLGCKRSELLRNLVAKEYAYQVAPDPF